jgi:hypothetical protein
VIRKHLGTWNIGYNKSLAIGNDLPSFFDHTLQNDLYFYNRSNTYE